MELKVGDWVRSYSSGIWQIYRILDYKCSDPLTGNSQNKTSIFVKRFVSNSFKRSFKQESCDPLIITKLGREEQLKLDGFIKDNPDLYKKFNELAFTDIDCIYNARIGIPENSSIESIASKFESTGYIKDIDIQSMLVKMGFKTKDMPSWTVQFISDNYHCIDGHLAFKFARVLEF